MGSWVRNLELGQFRLISNLQELFISKAEVYKFNLCEFFLFTVSFNLFYFYVNRIFRIYSIEPIEKKTYNITFIL